MACLVIVALSKGIKDVNIPSSGIWHLQWFQVQIVQDKPLNVQSGSRGLDQSMSQNITAQLHNYHQEKVQLF